MAVTIRWRSARPLVTRPTTSTMLRRQICRRICRRPARRPQSLKSTFFADRSIPQIESLRKQSDRCDRSSPPELLRRSSRHSSIAVHVPVGPSPTNRRFPTGKFFWRFLIVVEMQLGMLCLRSIGLSLRVKNSNRRVDLRIEFGSKPVAGRYQSAESITSSFNPQPIQRRPG